MSQNIENKVIMVTGAASGFGRQIAVEAAAAGGRLVCGDLNGDVVAAVVGEITSAGGKAIALRCDVASIEDMRALAAAAVEAFGRIDVMINNAGTMPLAFYADHGRALDAWHRAIDINIKGTLNGIVAVHDQMMLQGRGHIINISSIYGNRPVVGAAVYGATKAAINYLSEALRVESRGKIKVTVIKPAGVPATGLNGTIINGQAGIGIFAQNNDEFMQLAEQFGAGTLAKERLDPENIDYAVLAPDFITQAVLHVIEQPWGVAISDVTVRASGDYHVI